MWYKIFNRKKITRIIYRNNIITIFYDDNITKQYIFNHPQWYELPNLKKTNKNYQLTVMRNVMRDTSFFDTNESFDILLKTIPEDIISNYMRKIKIKDIKKNI